VYADVFAHLATLKTYSVDRAPKMAFTKRTLRLAGMLMQEGIAVDADEQLKLKLTDELAKLRDGFAKKNPDWAKTVKDGGEIEVDVTSVAVGSLKVTGRNKTRMVLSQENIDLLYEESGRALAAGEGLHRAYWKRFEDKAKPNECKLELFAVVRQAATQPALEEVAKKEFNTLWNDHKAAINQLPAGDRARFRQLMLASGTAVEHEWVLPDKIVEKPGESKWANHLYTDAAGDFAVDLNGWETAFLNWTHGQSDFHCWLRNFERRDWAFCIPYNLGGQKAFYPDFVIVRKQGKGFVVDLLEPHDDSRTDTWAKVQGLAQFADAHGISFGRLMVARKIGDTLEMVDVSDLTTREKARKMQSAGDLGALFEEIGS